MNEPLVTSIIKHVGLEAFYIEMYNFEELPSGCWRYLGHLDKDGYAYGNFTRKFQHIPMYRLWLELWTGKALSGGVVDHTCRGRDCINPRHLEIVSVAENTRRGNSAKLTYQDIKEIRDLLSNGRYVQAHIARLYGVTPGNITYIKQGHTWT